MSIENWESKDTVEDPPWPILGTCKMKMSTLAEI